MKKRAFSLPQSYLIVAIAYLLAIAVFVIPIFLFPVEWYWQLFIGDLFGTLIIWVFSIFADNVSLYDPYWSVMPWVIMTYVFVRYAHLNVFVILLFAAFSFWSWRLNINWALRFKDGLNHEDWRYAQYREKMGKAFHLFSLVALMLMETVLVYSALLPALFAMCGEMNAFSLIGTAIVLAGTLFELFADYQMELSHKENSSSVCEKGLWKYSRHPNYLGENLIWLGCFLVCFIPAWNMWYLVFGFLAILALFLFASIPMMEKRQLARRPEYAAYKAKTSMFLLLPRKKD